jgi:uncharacterized protein (TIGR02118 family)
VGARLIALYSAPDDTGAFDRHYQDVHTPIILRYPRLRELRLTKVEPMGPRSQPLYLQAEMAFDSRADLDAAIASDAGIESARDLRNFASAGVTLYVVDDDAVEAIRPTLTSEEG